MTVQNEEANVYRRWKHGEISDEEAREFFGDDFERIKQMAQNDTIVEETPDPDADDDSLFFDA